MLGELSFILVAFAGTALLVKALVPFAWRVGWLDKPDARKHHGDAVPLTGGVAMMAGFALAMLFADPYPVRLVGGMFALCVIGLLDDLFHLSPLSRLFAQGLVVFAACLLKGLHLCYLGNLFGFGEVVLPHWAGLALLVFCILGMINAVNMIDGVDGLAGGVLLMALVWLVFLGAREGAYILPALTLVGALGGYLLFNMRSPLREKAAVFMGDAGSTMLGFAVTWLLVIAARNEVAEAKEFPVVLVAWLLAVPILDTVSLIIARGLRGHHPFKADRDHIHHILQRAGLSDREVTVTVVAMALLGGGFGVGAWMLGAPEPFLFWSFVLLFGVYFYTIHHTRQVMQWFRRITERRACQGGGRELMEPVKSA